MAFDKQLFDSIIEEFTVAPEELRTIAADFRYDLKQGLADPEQSSLRMLKSYLGLPTGKEQGEYLALDFGGTNVRVLRIRLEGEGKFEILKKVAKPLIVEGEYDYIGASSTKEQMFGLLAELIDEAVEGNHEQKYLLGHTFSFPSSQTDVNNARLIIWTKEFATPGVEGEVVNDLLKEALDKRGLTNVEPVAVLNDTVAVLLSAAYKQSGTYIGSIYATGHNTCYLEPNVDGVPMILNLESGGFMKLLPSRFDNVIDEQSEKPGEQRLEKMVSGRYMGELYSLALSELLGAKDKWKSYGFTAIDLSGILADEGKERSEVQKIVAERTGGSLTAADAEMARDLAVAISKRSARLVTATFVGIIWQLTGSGKVQQQHIAVDGSVYEKMPFVKENIMRALSELLGEEAAQVDTVLDNGGSGLGAALAAAMAKA